MMQTFFGIIAMVLSVLGAVSIIRYIALKLTVCRYEKRIYAVLLQGEADIQLQMLFDTIEWDTTLNGAVVYAVDGGLDDIMAEYCRALCEGTGVRFLSLEEARGIKELF